MSKQYTITEALQYMLHDDQHVVFEVVKTENGSRLMKSLFLFLAFNWNGFRYLSCIEEPLSTAIPHIMTHRKNIPMECKWIISERTKSDIQRLVEEMGERTL